MEPVQCEKCKEVVPEIYLSGNANDDMWIECLETGWYCPKHSPTNTCNNDECTCNSFG